MMNESDEETDFIKIASVDVRQALVHSALDSLAEANPRISELLHNCEKENFVEDTHVTMVHFSQLPQSTIQTQFEPLVGCAVGISICGILWNEQVAALQVKVSTETIDDKPVPVPKNDFVHITFWHQPDVSAAYANELPKLVTEGKAEQVDFDEPIILQGVVSLWGEDRG